MDRRKIILYLAVLLFSTACNKYEDGVAYYKAEGEGYVFYKDSKTPASFAEIQVISGFPYHGWFLPTNSPIYEYYSADKDGYYKIRFIKNVRGTLENPDGFSVYFEVHTSTYDEHGLELVYNGEKHFDKGFLKKQRKTFKIDTIWLSKMYRGDL